MPKSALKQALEKAEIETPYRSGLEKNIAAQLDAAGIQYGYETVSVPYEVPARMAKYLSDFPVDFVLQGKDGFEGIVIEGKGHFGANNYGARFSNMKNNSAKERQKFVLLKEQHPKLDIRFVFSRASVPIYKGSKTTHAKWAADHGFRWAEKVIPPDWIAEIKTLQRKKRATH
jgi:hypothetical protein